MSLQYYLFLNVFVEDSAIYCRYTVTTDAVCILESYNVSKIEYKVSKMARESLSQTISYWSQGMLPLLGAVERTGLY